VAPDWASNASPHPTTIFEREEAPILHVLDDNRGAIALYERLGFIVRTTFHLTAVHRSDAMGWPPVPVRGVRGLRRRKPPTSVKSRYPAAAHFILDQPITHQLSV
jgi:hypothetical protein